MENTSWKLSSLTGFFVQDTESYICQKGKKDTQTLHIIQFTVCERKGILKYRYYLKTPGFYN